MVLVPRLASVAVGSVSGEDMGETEGNEKGEEEYSCVLDGCKDCFVDGSFLVGPCRLRLLPPLRLLMLLTVLLSLLRLLASFFLLQSFEDVATIADLCTYVAVLVFVAACCIVVETLQELSVAVVVVMVLPLRVLRCGPECSKPVVFHDQGICALFLAVPGPRSRVDLFAAPFSVGVCLVVDVVVAEHHLLDLVFVLDHESLVVSVIAGRTIGGSRRGKRRSRSGCCCRIAPEVIVHHLLKVKKASRRRS